MRVPACNFRMRFFCATSLTREVGDLRWEAVSSIVKVERCSEIGTTSAGWSSFSRLKREGMRSGREAWELFLLRWRRSEKDSCELDLLMGE